ncbi:MAG TPA: PspC domain-containing protein [Candidatus Saccharimonadales bacterium]|nr:PspC domain-containing protein [Candidatus Saccharimonadales bacterium]
MNEIRNIHLGRQAYTVSADAYKELHAYLEAIQRQVGKEVAEEVELRMAELLAERGVTGKKVVLQKDVDYLKEQLGKPGDFSEDHHTDDEPTAKQTETGASEKRLFRDTDNAMIAGVAAGLAKYLDIDTVIVRLIFIALVFFGGSGILLYVVLWLLVPEAKTNSERLQMRGLAVNVENIKHAVSGADVPGATRRASKVVGGFIATLVKVLLGVVGVGLIVGGLAVLLGSAGSLMFGLIRGVQVSNAPIFPIGKEEIAALVCAFVVVGLIASMVVASGVALVRRKWPMPGWAVAAVVGLFIAAGAVGTGFGLGVAPQVKSRVDALRHNRTVTLAQPIQRLHVLGTKAAYRVVYDTKPSVEIHAFGNVQPSDVTITEQNGLLTVDTRGLAKPSCTLFCPFDDGNSTEVVIHAPNPDTLPADTPGGASFTIRNNYKEIYRDGNLHYFTRLPQPPSGN